MFQLAAFPHYSIETGGQFVFKDDLNTVVLGMLTNEGDGIRNDLIDIDGFKFIGSTAAEFP